MAQQTSQSVTATPGRLHSFSAKSAYTPTAAQVAKVNGIDTTNVVTLITSDYTAVGPAYIVCNNTSAVTVTLPVLAANVTITVVRANTGSVTIDGDGATITGSATQTLPLRYDAAALLGTTLEWLLV
jgi:hypothetical protein